MSPQMIINVVIAMSTISAGSIGSAIGRSHMLPRTRPAVASISGWPAQPDFAPSSVIRYCYEGGTLKRDGRLLALDGNRNGKEILCALQGDGVNLTRFESRVYDPTLKGWAPLDNATQFAEGLPMHIDVRLFRQRDSEEAIDAEAREGYFSIGVVGLKSSHNLGTLWRSAFQQGAASIFVVGDRYNPQTSDTVKAWRHVPLVHHADWNAFAAASPYGALWVAVEMGGEPLEDFEHPERAVYILGSEDSGLPESVLAACHRTVSLPSERYESFNVAVAGSVVLYDRLAKHRRSMRRRQKGHS